jgi:CubicO group peptidase (beta-lactamase class C family)
MTLMKKIFTTLLLMAVASCSTTYEAKINFDKNSKVDISNYKTFAWLTSGKIMAPAEDFNPVMKQRVDEEIENNFIAKGYQLIDDAEKADFAISYTVGNRDKIQVNSYPPTYNVGFGWGGGYYGGRYGAHMDTRTHVRQYTEGKLAIDVYDVKSHQPAWHGWAVKRITSGDKEAPSSTIKDVVHKLLSQFN